MFGEDTKDVKGQKLEFDGIPFFLLGTKVYDCQHGQDRNTSLKAKLQQSRKRRQVRNIQKHL